MTAWPATLPQYLEGSGGYNEAPANGMLRTSMDSGPAKRRSRFTKIPVYITGVLAPLTSAQVDILQAFYTTTCLNGTLTFTWVHPRTGNAATFAWMDASPPITMWNGPAVFQAALKLEVVG